MRVHIASDHAGLELKQIMIQSLQKSGYDVVDHGAEQFDAQDDYPDFCIPCAEAVRAEPDSLGIVLGGSGNGEQIAANYVPGIRAALAYNEETAQLARQHNNAQVVGIGARMHSADDAIAIATAFLTTKFSGEERHQRRIDKLTAYQNGLLK